MPSAADLARRRRTRWAVPVGAVAAVGIVIAASVIGGAQAAPNLPARTTAQLLAAVDRPAAWPAALTGVAQETASLGLPDLPGADDPLSGLSLLSGTHTLKVWYDGPNRVRIAVPAPLGEADLRRDGNSVWLWNSRTNRATHFLLPADAGQAPDAPAPALPTPQQLAQQILAAVGKTTTVGLQQNVTVAGQAAYQLSLAPKDSRSLVGQVRIAIGAEYSLPLQVQVFARGATSPAFSLGYTSLSFATPAASNFAFAPPPGATVNTVTVPAGPAVPGGLPNLPAGTVPTAVPVAPPLPGSITLRMGGSGRTVTVAGGKPLPPAVRRKLQAVLAQSMPASMSKAQRAAVLQSLASAPPGTLESVSGDAGKGNVAVFSSVGAMSSGASTVMGQGWLSVAVLPAQLPAPPPGQATAPGGLAQAIIALQNAATPVHGSWGSGRLLRTSLVSVLMTNGHILVGAVQPAVLYADAAQLGT
jgi:outer membrane lipoprotein-sorting protein